MDEGDTPRHFPPLQGIEFADSIAFNPSKWLMVHFDCTAMWWGTIGCLLIGHQGEEQSLAPPHLQRGAPLPEAREHRAGHRLHGEASLFPHILPQHWQVPLSKRFRALKLWFVLRNYGVSGLQKMIRENVRLAEKFEVRISSLSCHLPGFCAI